MPICHTTFITHPSVYLLPKRYYAQLPKRSTSKWSVVYHRPPRYSPIIVKWIYCCIRAACKSHIIHYYHWPVRAKVWFGCQVSHYHRNRYSSWLRRRNSALLPHTMGLIRDHHISIQCKPSPFCTNSFYFNHFFCSNFSVWRGWLNKAAVDQASFNALHRVTWAHSKAARYCKVNLSTLNQKHHIIII